VMRRYLLENMPRVGFSIQEKMVTSDDLLNADEMFLTNAIRGIRWVGSFQARQFTNQLTAKVYQQLIA
jgi:branched-chain amino acid aminotransferase